MEKSYQFSSSNLSNIVIDGNTQREIVRKRNIERIGRDILDRFKEKVEKLDVDQTNLPLLEVRVRYYPNQTSSEEVSLDEIVTVIKLLNTNIRYYRSGNGSGDGHKLPYKYKNQIQLRTEKVTELMVNFIFSWNCEPYLN